MEKTFGLVPLAAAILLGACGAHAQFDLGGDARVNPADFEISVFADSLNYPVGMAELEDGSILVAVSNGREFFNSFSGRILRLVDEDGDGVADTRITLAARVPGGGLTTVRTAGDLIFTTGQGQGKPITIYRRGATLSDTLVEQGRLFLTYPSGWHHPHSALGLRPTPGQEKSYDLFFQVGSKENFARTSAQVKLTSTLGLEASLNGDAIHKVRIIDTGEGVEATDLVQIATGLRNPAGYAFQPLTGDLYFEDNGIDGLVDANEPTSADELNIIPVDQIGGPIEDFGFPENHIVYRTGEFAGGQGIPPLVAFLPLPEAATGSESEGPNDIAFAPPEFPPGLNDGIFVTFHGRFSSGGLGNEENPLVYVDLGTGKYFHFIENDEPRIGHLDGLLATGDKLYVADISPRGAFRSSAANTGVIYLIRAKERPTAVEEVASRSTPAAFSLADAHPNPFNPQTTIRFTVPELGGALPARLSVYNITGQKVATLADEEVRAGVYEVEWDGRDAQGRLAGSGVYIYRLSVGDRFRASKRMTLLK